MRCSAVRAAAFVALAVSACTSEDATKLELTVGNAGRDRTYTLFCDDAGGSHPNADAACRALEDHHGVMLADLYPGQTCIGGLWTVHIRVLGKYRNKSVRGRPDSCSGNPEAERLWMKDLPELSRGP